MNKKEAPGSAEAELFQISKLQSKINLYNLIRTKKNPDIWNQDYRFYVGRLITRNEKLSSKVYAIPNFIG